MKEHPESSHDQQSTSSLQSHLRRCMIDHLMKRLDIDEHAVDTARSFPDYGLASVEAINLLRELEDIVGYSLPPTLIWEYPSIDALLIYLTSDTK